MIGDIRRKTTDSCGYDFYAPDDIDLEPGEYVTIDTGVRFDGKERVYSDVKLCHPVIGDYQASVEYDNWFMLVVPRSGLGTKYGTRFANTVGIIDKDYRDNIRATMTVDRPLHINKGERYMQGILVPNLYFENETKPTEERKGGYGSTGM